MLQNLTIGIIGGGNMAEALIRGVLQGGKPASSLVVAEPEGKRREYLAGRYSVKVSADNRVVATESDVIVIAVKPQVAVSAFTGIVDVVTGEKLIISIMAGVTTSGIEELFPGPVRVIRAMPNTPAIALQGATAVAAGSHATADDLRLAQNLFHMVGKCWTVDEKQLDAVTGLSGSGPAYVLTFIEALSDAGVKNGLPREVSFGLALQTVAGTASLLIESGEHPALLREKVTSPGGTTIAGLQALETGGFRGTVMRCVEAATTRSAELGKKNG